MKRTDGLGRGKLFLDIFPRPVISFFLLEIVETSSIFGGKFAACKKENYYRSRDKSGESVPHRISREIFRLPHHRRTFFVQEIK